MTLAHDILRDLNKGPRTYEGLESAFPQSNLAHVLITLEKQNLVENREGAWIITKKGRGFLTQKKDSPRKVTIPYKKLAYVALLIPALFFLFLSNTYYSEYSDLQKANAQLLTEREGAQTQLSQLYEEKSAAEAEKAAQLKVLNGEQETTAELKESYAEVEESVSELQSDVDYYQCLEQCTPDTFVTVDNAYVKARVDEICAGLSTLQQKQKAIYRFVQSEIKEDDSIFRFGRLDMWEYPEDILKRGKGHYEDKFLLLLTMLRTAGTSAEHVRFVAAKVDGASGWIWVELYDGETWWVLDPLVGYTFTTNPRDEFYTKHKVEIQWWFNDVEFRRG